MGYNYERGIVMRYAVSVLMVIFVVAMSGCSSNADDSEPLDIVVTNGGGEMQETGSENEEGIVTGNTESISMIVDNAHVGFYTPPFIEDYKTLVPLGDVAEGAGY